MIDPMSSMVIEDCDGESISCFGFDPDSGKWEWQWVPLEYVAEAGRSDIMERLFGRPYWDEAA